MRGNAGQEVKMAFQITYGSLTQYFHNVAQGRSRGLVSPTQIANALSGMLQRAADAAGPNPLHQTLGERLAALRNGPGQTYGYGQGQQGYGRTGAAASWSPYARGFSLYA
jgi:hypothetical protein